MGRLAEHKLDSQSSFESSTVLKSRSQSEIIASRRKARRARINAVYNEVSHIINQNSDLSITGRYKLEEQLEYDIYSAAREIAASKE
jgi:hypothetical protein